MGVQRDDAHGRVVSEGGDAFVDRVLKLSVVRRTAQSSSNLNDVYDTLYKKAQETFPVLCEQQFIH